MVRVVLMKLVSQKEVMNQEETDEAVADETSQEVDFRDETMRIEKSDQ